VGHLTRNVNEDHVREIFSTFGTLKSVELSIDKVCAPCYACGVHAGSMGLL
jgi:RNA recognition motif-containing protein